MVRTIKKYTLESFSECTGIGNVVEVGRKSVPGGWATVGETSFPKSGSSDTIDRIDFRADAVQITQTYSHLAQLP